MKTIYSISENYQAYDSDGWAHWKESTMHHRFFESKEGAEAYVAGLLAVLEERAMEGARLHANVKNADYYEQTINDARMNIVRISEQNNGIGELTEFTRYEVVEVPLYE